jgi:NADH-quinone oxidoreductase subunit E
MTNETKKKLEQVISDASIKAINEQIAHYPDDQRQSAVMRALMIVQEECNHLTTELMDAVADYLNMPSIAVYEVATFYSLYEHEPVGKHVISVCRSISCHLRGADKIINNLEQILSIECGQTTKDACFTLKTAECLGACVNAPMMQIDKDYHERLHADGLSEILEKYN